MGAHARGMVGGWERMQGAWWVDGRHGVCLSARKGQRGWIACTDVWERARGKVSTKRSLLPIDQSPPVELQVCPSARLVPMLDPAAGWSLGQSLPIARQVRPTAPPSRAPKTPVLRHTPRPWVSSTWGPDSPVVRQVVEHLHHQHVGVVPYWAAAPGARVPCIAP